ncbi:MAG: protoheme IX farnesyltransferase [Chloroflexi bacterium]|nr:protoheme IX farnesyltransferase [Chloroflexota bacterium]
MSALVAATLGGVVRVTGSGLGCPDWPTCHGQIIPPFQIDAWVEYIHRLGAAATIPLTLLTTAAGLLRQPRRLGPWLLLGSAPLLLIAQVILGALTVLLELPPGVALVHTAVALAFVSVLGLIVGGLAKGPADLATGTHPAAGYRGIAVALLAATFITGVTGAWVYRSGASLACLGLPLCGGEATSPEHATLQLVHMLHRLAGVVLGLLSLALLWRAGKPGPLRPSLLRASLGIAFLLATQAALGIFNFLLLLPTWSRIGHLAGSALLMAAVSLLVGSLGSRVSGLGLRVSGGCQVVGPNRGQRPATTDSRVGSALVEYLRLAKPNIMVLLLLTTLAAMLAAGRGSLSWGLALATLVAGGLASAGAATLNSLLDQDLDAVMARTRGRPLPSGRVSRAGALRAGITFSLLSLVLFIAFVNLTSALLTAVALAYYVLFYSVYLKRRTHQNIVIGGAAGAFPPLIGWTAVTGTVEPEALFLFLIIFFWTPPHAWALTLLAKDDYVRAGIPMLPVARGEPETRRQILLYSISLLALTLIPSGLRLFGPVYLGIALLLGLLFVAMATSLYRSPDLARVRRLYRFSTLYLALFFLGLVLDRTLVAT